MVEPHCPQSHHPDISTDIRKAVSCIENQTITNFLLNPPAESIHDLIVPIDTENMITNPYVDSKQNPIVYLKRREKEVIEARILTTRGMADSPSLD